MGRINTAVVAMSSGHKRSRACIEEEERKLEPPAKKIKANFDTDRCKCVICFDVQWSCTAYQCSNSHIVCSGCYDQITDDPKLCPTCRVSIQEPIRPSFIDWTMGT